jgi:hypothetical protein
MAKTPWRRSTLKLEVDASVEHTEAATVPGGAPSAGTGKFWVRNDTPNVPMFTDDTGADHVLNAGASTGSAGFIYQNLQFYVDALNEGSYPGTGTTVTDLQGNGTAGTLATAVYQNGGFEFNGTSGTLTFTKGATLDNIFTGGGTVIAMVQTNSHGELNEGRIVTTEGAGTVGWVLAVDAESNDYVRVRFVRQTDTVDGVWTVNDIDGNRPVRNGTWTCIGLSYDDTVLANNPTIYIQGTSVAFSTTTPTGAMQSDAGQAIVIGNRAADDRTFNGTIGVVLLFDRILSAQEHALIFSELGTRYGSGLRGRIQQTTGLPASDLVVSAGDYATSGASAGAHGGNLVLRAGNTASTTSSANGGNLYLYAGTGASSARGGSFILKGGTAGTQSLLTAEVAAGDVNSGNLAGNLLVHGGDNTSTGSAGDLILRAGNSTDGNGGDVLITGGTAGLGDTPGDVVIRSGQNASAVLSTGTITITTEATSGTPGPTGAILIATGSNTGVSSTAVGAITLQGGNSNGSGDAGSLNFIGGAGTTASSAGNNGGSLNFTGGASTDGDGGGFVFTAGNSGSNDASDPAGGFTFTGGNQTNGTAVANSGGGGFTFTGGSSAKGDTGSPGGGFSVTAGTASAASANARGGSISLTGGAVTGGTAGSIAGGVTLNGGAASGSGTHGTVRLLTSGTGAGVGVRTQSTFTSTLKESFTYGAQVVVGISSTVTLVTLGSLTVDGRNMKFTVYGTGTDNAATGQHVSFYKVESFYRTGGTVASMTAHMNDTKNTGTAADFGSDITFTVVASGNNILLQATNASGGTAYTGNFAITWERQEGGFSS